MNKTLVTAAIAILSGCGGGLKDAARATTLAGTILTDTREVMVAARREELDSCSDVECLDRVTASWSVPLEAYEATRLAHSLLVDALVVAQIADSDGASSQTLSAALSALSDAALRLVSALQSAGHPLPPELVTAMNVLTSVLRSIV